MRRGAVNHGVVSRVNRLIEQEHQMRFADADGSRDAEHIGFARYHALGKGAYRLIRLHHLRCVTALAEWLVAQLALFGGQRPAAADLLRLPFVETVWALHRSRGYRVAYRQPARALARFAGEFRCVAALLPPAQ